MRDAVTDGWYFKKCKTRNDFFSDFLDKGELVIKYIWEKIAQLHVNSEKVGNI